MTESPQRLTLEGIQAALERSPFAVFLGLRVLAADHEAQTLRIAMPMRPELERKSSSAQAHGGAIASLIDVAGDFAVGMLVGGGVPTINLSVDYLRPASGGELQAIASVRRLGRTLGVVDIDVIDMQAKLIAIGRASYSAVRG
jgi:uncharacterized protein (TIGR00369 family)